jgi:hypothetical protein
MSTGAGGSGDHFSGINLIKRNFPSHGGVLIDENIPLM